MPQMAVDLSSRGEYSITIDKITYRMEGWNQPATAPNDIWINLGKNQKLLGWRRLEKKEDPQKLERIYEIVIVEGGKVKQQELRIRAGEKGPEVTITDMVVVDGVTAGPAKPVNVTYQPTTEPVDLSITGVDKLGNLTITIGGDNYSTMFTLPQPQIKIR